jgi:hypothetical protein
LAVTPGNFFEKFYSWNSFRLDGNFAEPENSLDPPFFDLQADQQIHSWQNHDNNQATRKNIKPFDLDNWWPTVRFTLPGVLLFVDPGIIYRACYLSK